MQGRQARDHRQEAHDRDVADREQALQALGLHRLAADAEEVDARGIGLAQRPHQLEAELVAGMLARDERDAQRTAPCRDRSRRETRR